MMQTHKTMNTNGVDLTPLGDGTLDASTAMIVIKRLSYESDNLFMEGVKKLLTHPQLAESDFCVEDMLTIMAMTDYQQTRIQQAVQDLVRKLKRLNQLLILTKVDERNNLTKDEGFLLMKWGLIKPGLSVITHSTDYIRDMNFFERVEQYAGELSDDFLLSTFKAMNSNQMTRTSVNFGAFVLYACKKDRVLEYGYPDGIHIVVLEQLNMLSGVYQQVKNDEALMACFVKNLEMIFPMVDQVVSFLPVYQRMDAVLRRLVTKVPRPVLEKTRYFKRYKLENDLSL